MKPLSEDEVDLMNNKMKIKKLKNYNRSKTLLMKGFDAKEGWRKTLTKLRPIFMLTHLTEQIQLYGSPAYSDSEFHYNTMVSSANESSTKPNAKRNIVPSFIIHPKSIFKSIWSTILVLPILYTAFFTPIIVAFIDNAHYINSAWSIIGYIIDGLFALDILFNMLSAFYDNYDELVVSHIKIIYRYFTTWLFLDIVSCLPLDLIIYWTSLESDSRDSNMKFYRLIKMIKLAKVFKENKGEGVLTIFFENVHAGAMTIRVVTFALTTIFFCNFFTCAWYSMSTFGDFKNTWVYNLGYSDESEPRLYAFSLLWTIYTFSTIGYGHIHSYNNGKEICNNRGKISKCSLDDNRSVFLCLIDWYNVNIL